MEKTCSVQTPQKTNISSYLAIDCEGDSPGLDRQYAYHFRWIQTESAVRLVLFFTLTVFVLFGYSLLEPTDILQIGKHHSGEESMADLVKSIPSTEYIKKNFHYYTSQDHLAGSQSDYEQAEWTKKKFMEYGLHNTTIDTYYPYLNFPIHREVSIITGAPELLFKASLQESDDSLPSFHGYSADGNVTGPVIYVNYGRLEDFLLLHNSHLVLEGSIALMRHGIIPSSMKVYHAESFGCIGALVYTDPSENNNHLISYQLNRGSNASTVHRDSVQYGFIHPGDPYTPGYAASKDSKRDETSSNLPQIPSLPLSWSDALPLLRATEGYGMIEPSWKGDLKNISYSSGPSIAKCNLINNNEFKIRPIWNVLTRIQGHLEADKVVIIGNHRDAWGQGAADPSSGSAVMLELARVFGILLEKGWRPRRTIIIASWDANEYGNVGSTEWVEDNLHWLNKKAVVYLNVDAAVTGSHFKAEGSPLLERILQQITMSVVDPKSGRSIYEAWVKEDTDEMKGTLLPLVKPHGSSAGLDTIAFYEHAGISSLSMAFKGEYGVSHSIFDSVTWMEKYGDPMYEYHQSMVRIWGLLVLRLSTDVILPMNPHDYSTTLKKYASRLKYVGNNTKHPRHKKKTSGYALSQSIQSLQKTTSRFNKELREMDRMVIQKKISHKLMKKIVCVNERLIQFERAFLSTPGLLAGRPWYRHGIYGPSSVTGLVSVFPSMAEAQDPDSSRRAEKEITKLIKRAQVVLSSKN
ncbi:hypothetical protein BDB01DRAFT_855053 [Pilobolus umbonatus]|nr:hypothetical protein BDB01DRAFT_855053 [Pilobolus umbonatus]